LIPFIYVHADGACVKEIERPIDVQVLADSFINRGGRYLLTLFVDDVVQLQAVVKGFNDEPHTIAVQTAPHGPLMLGAIDRLVRESVKQLDQVQ
jgi:hypothetical protein